MFQADNVEITGDACQLFPATRYTFNFAALGIKKSSIQVRQYLKYHCCGPDRWICTYRAGSVGGCGTDCMGCGNVTEFECIMTVSDGDYPSVGMESGNLTPPVTYSGLLLKYILETDEYIYDTTACAFFGWIGDICLMIGQILRNVGDRMGTVWFVGDVIQGWFNAVAGYFEGAYDWFYGLKTWCSQVVTGLSLGDAWTWVLGFFADPGGYITSFLGDVWTWVQSLYSNFSGAVTSVLGGTWTWVQGLYSDFSGAVTSVLGGAWTWVQGLYNDFSGAVFDVLGDVWSDLLDMHANFGSWVTGALGGTWTWLTEFASDPMSKLHFDIAELVKSAFEWLTQEWFSFLDESWDTFKGSFEWLLQKFFVILDESWNNFEGSVKWLVGKVLDLVGDAAEDLKYQIWDMVEKVMKKL